MIAISCALLFIVTASLELAHRKWGAELVAISIIPPVAAVSEIVAGPQATTSRLAKTPVQDPGFPAEPKCHITRSTSKCTGCMDGRIIYSLLCKFMWGKSFTWKNMQKEFSLKKTAKNPKNPKPRFGVDTRNKKYKCRLKLFYWKLGFRSCK